MRNCLSDSLSSTCLLSSAHTSKYLCLWWGVFVSAAASGIGQFAYLSVGFLNFFEGPGVGIAGCEEVVDVLLFDDPPSDWSS